MGTKYLIDSNTVIDFFNGKLPNAGRQLLSEAEPVISIITHIELFSGNNIINEEYQQLQRFVNIAIIYPVNLPIAAETISIRKKYKIKLPDALIAATAIVHNFTLITRNIADFKKIDNLKIINPYEVK
jgi:predicted nucleic acid-binding protein